MCTLWRGLTALSLTACAFAFTTPDAAAQRDSQTVAAGTRYQAGGFKRFLLGNTYRDEWTTPVRVPVLDLTRFAGGLTPTKSGQLAVCLAWNAKIAGGTAERFDGTATLYDLNLRVADGQAIVGESKSKIDNTENVWIDVEAGRTYDITVTAEGEPFDWDYGLAWLVSPP